MGFKLSDALVARRERLRKVLAESKLDILVIPEGALSSWVTGNPLSSDSVITVDGRLLPFIDYLSEVGNSALHVGVVAPFSSANLIKLIDVMQPASLVDATTLYRDVRRTKDDVEMMYLARAAKITSDALTGIDVRSIRHAIALDAELVAKFKEFGGDGPGFDTSIAIGESTSRQWVAPSSHRLEGQLAVVDAGTSFRGYKSDMTVVMAPERSPFRQNLDDLNEILLSIIELIENGERSTIEIVKAADQLYEAKGFPRCPHAIGHGIGIDLHERPFFFRSGNELLMPGDVFNIEPGFYFEDSFGMRLEQTIFIDQDNNVVQLNDPYKISTALYS